MLQGFISYRLNDLAKYRKYTRLRDCEGVYIIRRKNGVPAVTQKSAITVLLRVFYVLVLIWKVHFLFFSFFTLNKVNFKWHVFRYASKRVYANLCIYFRTLNNAHFLTFICKDCCINCRSKMNSINKCDGIYWMLCEKSLFFSTKPLRTWYISVTCIMQRFLWKIMNIVRSKRLIITSKHVVVRSVFILI